MNFELALLKNREKLLTLSINIANFERTLQDSILSKRSISISKLFNSTNLFKKSKIQIETLNINFVKFESNNNKDLNFINKFLLREDKTIDKNENKVVLFIETRHYFYLQNEDLLLIDLSIIIVFVENIYTLNIKKLTKALKSYS